jgi:hypothetical protein
VTIHLIKLAVGVDDIDHFVERQRLNKRGNVEHRTRMMPKRGDELLDGGSMYWVIRGFIQVRRALVDLRSGKDSGGKSICVLEMEPKVHLVQPRAQRAFQGWRYLKGDAVPMDIKGNFKSYIDPKMPKEMRLELLRLGLI